MAHPRNVIGQAATSHKSWDEMNGKLNVPGLNLMEFEDKLQYAIELSIKAEELKKERARIVRERDRALDKLWEATQKVKDTAFATFGRTAEIKSKFGGKP